MMPTSTSTQNLGKYKELDDKWSVYEDIPVWGLRGTQKGHLLREQPENPTFSRKA